MIRNAKQYDGYTEDIYKKYKHGESLKEFDPSRIYEALTDNNIQAFVVYDIESISRAWVYVPETNEWVNLS